MATFGLGLGINPVSLSGSFSSGTETVIYTVPADRYAVINIITLRLQTTGFPDCEGQVFFGDTVIANVKDSEITGGGTLVRSHYMHGDLTRSDVQDGAADFRPYFLRWYGLAAGETIRMDWDVQNGTTDYNFQILEIYNRG